MDEETDQKDGQRPLSPEEREFIRALRPLLTDADRVKKLERLLQNETEITQVAENYAHLSWGGKMLFHVAIWFSSIVGAVIAYQTLKTWMGVK